MSDEPLPELPLIKKRNTKFTPERADKILTILRNHGFRGTAARAAGIDPNTLSNWLALGEDRIVVGKDGKPAVRKARAQFIKFRQDVENAESASETELVKDIVETESWKAKAFILSRRYPDRWQERRAVEVSGPGGDPLPTAAAAPVVNVIVAGTAGDAVPFTFETDGDDKPED